MADQTTTDFQVCTRDDFLKDVVSQLVSRRRELGLTQEDVDIIVGNSDRLVSKWECGSRTPTAFNLYCWSDALGVRITLIANHHSEHKTL